MRTRVYFDGTELTAFTVVSDLQRPLLPRRAEYVSVPGADGAIFAGVVDDTRTLRLTLTIKGNDPTRRAHAARQLASVLDVDSPRPLHISEDAGLYYMAMPNASADGTRYLNGESFEVEFTCDPFMYGRERSFAVNVANNGTQRIVVTGTRPVPVALDVRLTSGGTWRLAVDGKDYYTAQVSGATSLTLDAGSRVARRTGDLYALPPTNDWLWLEPGAHTLTSYGVGIQGTLTYTERWS